jgi:hypothetical protein
VTDLVGLLLREARRAHPELAGRADDEASTVRCRHVLGRLRELTLAGDPEAAREWRRQGGPFLELMARVLAARPDLADRSSDAAMLEFAEILGLELRLRPELLADMQAAEEEAMR